MEEFKSKKKVFVKEAVSPEQFESDSGVFGSWKMEKLLGRNAVGELYRASKELGGDSADSKRLVVAFRIFDPSLARNPRLVKRFLQEGEKLQSISHPNIVPVTECGRAADGTPYIARTYIEGQTLGQLAEEGPVDFYRAIEILRAIAAALQEASRHELLHRNLNPSSVFIDDYGAVSVADFGQSKGVPAEGSDTLGLTHYGAQMLDLRYVSPEQMGDKKVDLRSDLYSLGCIAYLLFTGADIFAGVSGFSLLNVKMLEKYDHDAFDYLNFSGSEKLRGQAVKGADTFVENLISPNEELRYQSVEQVLQDLDKLKAGKPLRALNVARSGKPVKAPQLTRLKVAAAIAGAGILLCAFLFFAIPPAARHVQADQSAGHVAQSPPFELDEPGTSTKFSSADLRKSLPGVWRYKWGTSQGVIQIQNVVFIDKLRAFVGLMERDGKVFPIAGRVSVMEDGLMLTYPLADGAFAADMSAKLVRTEGGGMAFVSATEEGLAGNGFTAQKTSDQRLPGVIEDYRISSEIEEGLRGIWHSVGLKTGMPDHFYIRPMNEQGIFELRDLSDFTASKKGPNVLGLAIVTNEGDMTVEYLEDWTPRTFRIFEGKAQIRNGTAVAAEKE
ncbi:MAG: serine/threonine protein kinase [Cyanobacteria bacterium SZAS TMP-1]|nr:serine/threonine protein kinase [Cyanobacteria bacterium SZAS TMP-1]